MQPKSCTRSDDRTTISIFPGWHCCKCRTYNSFLLGNCRNENCRHAACYTISNPNERLPYRSTDGTGRKFVAFCDPPSTARVARKAS